MEPLSIPYRPRKEIAAHFGYDLKGYINDFFQRLKTRGKPLVGREEIPDQVPGKNMKSYPDHEDVTNFTK